MATKSSLTPKIAEINNLISKDKKEHGLAVVFFLWVKGEKWYSVNAMHLRLGFALLRVQRQTKADAVLGLKGEDTECLRRSRGAVCRR